MENLYNHQAKRVGLTSQREEEKENLIFVRLAAEIRVIDFIIKLLNFAFLLKAPFHHT